MVNCNFVEYACRKDGMRLLVLVLVLVLGAEHGNEVCASACIHELMGKPD